MQQVPGDRETDHAVFDGVAGAYARTRPGYPEAALDWIECETGLAPASDVLDLGAGTGKLTRSLVARGHRVVAVEPLPGMREELERERSTERVLEGSAEQIPLADGSVDGVFVGQAFHWFEPQAALDEIARVLRPGGALALLWNLWDLDDPLQARVDAIVAPLGTGRIRVLTTGSHPYGTWSSALAADPRFDRHGQARFGHRVVLDADAAAERVASISQVQSAPAEARADAIDAARALVAALPGGRGAFAYQTEIDIARRADPR